MASNNSIIQTLSSSSSSSSSSYDVFLSFRGNGIDSEFVKNLYIALKHKGIYTFKYNEIWVEREKQELLKLVDESRFAIIVFSENYASSHWCLDEILRIMECTRRNGLVAVPIFYRVEASQVRKQTGCFGEALSRLEADFRDNTELMKQWREALAQAADIPGWVIPNPDNDRESECIKQIVGDIFCELGGKDSSAAAAADAACNLHGIEPLVTA